jgi:hypothetical protein
MSKFKPSPIVSGRYFPWRLFRRGGIYYADGRGGAFDLGKHSLGTRDREQALQQLSQLDELKAAELGLVEAAPPNLPSTTTISEGWRQYLEQIDSSQVMGGVSQATIKRYGAVRDKHVKFCRQHGIESWQAFDEPALRRYGTWLAKHSADRTVYLELTLLKSLNVWLIRGGEAVRLLGIGIDHGTRSICIKDGIDTEDDTWESDALDAASKNVAHCQWTSMRIKQKMMNRFRKFGATGNRAIYGYIVPVGSKSYDDWLKDPQAEEHVLEGARILRATLSGEATADYFRQHRVPCGPFARNATWDGTMVLRHYRKSPRRSKNDPRRLPFRRHLSCTSRWLRRGSLRRMS